MHLLRWLMLSLRKPSPEQVATFLKSQADYAFSYPYVGSSAGDAPAGYVVDHTRARIGSGDHAFNRAWRAVGRLQQFDLGWVGAWSPDETLQKGSLVAIVAKTVAFWWMNACRVIYLIDDEQGAVRRHGFAYGTLPGHAEMGEERFIIEWNRADDSVTYDVLAYSRPSHFLAKCAYPIARRFQKRFARDSVARMRRAVEAPGGNEGEISPELEAADAHA